MSPQVLGPVAHYDFSDGAGTTLHDISGNGNEGTIHNARWIERRKGFCLEFNGVDSFVCCGAGPSLELTDAMTLEAWVWLDSILGEAGIAGKRHASYFLSYYADDKCYSYINSGTDFVSVGVPVQPGSWHHVVTTFDGKMLSFYVDGEISGPATPSNFSTINGNKDQPFLIGVNVTNQNINASPYFKGLLSEVRVYNRALSASEVSENYQAGEKQLQYLEYHSARAFTEVKQGQLSIGAGENGQVRIETGAVSYLLESDYSYVGPRIGWNYLAETEQLSEPGWSPTVQITSSTSIEIEAKGLSYSLKRRVRIGDKKIYFEDYLTNTGALSAAFIIWNRITGLDPFVQTFAPKFADNPTIYLASGKDTLGILIEDDISRVSFEPSLGVPDNQARFRLSNLVLDPGKGYTLQWTVYLFHGIADYFDFINRVRQDWHTNFTIDGPFALFDANPLTNPLVDIKNNVENKKKLKEYLHRKRLKIVALLPFLDYDPNTFDHVLRRSEFKAVMKDARDALKAVDPNIICLGCIETDWVTVYLDDVDPENTIPRDLGSHVLKGREKQLIENAKHPWKDSMKHDPEQRLTLYNYPRGGNMHASVAVYPTIGNYQYTFLVQQVEFLLEDVGLDGCYIDDFSQAGWTVGGIRSYSSPDGWSGEVNAATGSWNTQYTDCDLAGRTARRALCQYALKKGKVVVANTWASSAQERDLTVYRFAETWGNFEPGKIDISDFPDTGAEPKPIAMIFRGNLGSPIGFGTQGNPPVPTAKRLMKAVIAYLRHGLLYYHYHIEDIPIGEGEYGPINHMFPITPVALHKGWIEGKERIVTAVSGTYRWKHKSKPHIHRFDLLGREVTPHGFGISSQGAEWIVDVSIANWAEIVILE